MATATLHANGRVNLNMPNVSILVDRGEAETLRAALNAVLQEQAEAREAQAARERDLMLDPTIRDIDVLRAAQAIATEQECHRVVQQLAHMVTLYCADDEQLEDGRQLLSELRDLPRSPDRKLHLLSIMGDVEPVLSGPFKDEKDRVEAAQDYRRAHGDEDGLYRIDATGDVTVDTFTGNELLPDHPQRCALCRCDATEAKHDIAVCLYHVDHGEDDPPCPTCECEPPERAPTRRVRWVSDEWINGRNATLATAERRLSPAMVERTYTVEAYVLDRHRLPERRHTKRFPNHTDAETAADRWTHAAEWPGHTEQPDVYDPPAEVVEDEDEYPVHVGDRVRDPSDGRWRTVERIGVEGTVHMTDGGCMNADECYDIRLPSEALD